MAHLLSEAFVQFPIRVDASRLQHEIHQLEPSLWQSHHLPNMRSVSLVKIGPTCSHTDAFDELPYLKELLGAWGLPIGESRISLLETGGTVDEHVDVEFYWKHRLRIHIVVQSNSSASFGCDGHVLNLPEGQVWVSNNWAPHWIANHGTTDRIHVVVDTVGSPIIWQWIATGWTTGQHTPYPTNEHLPLFECTLNNQPIRLEQSEWGQVRTPTEVQEIIVDMLAEAPGLSSTTEQHLKRFVQNWRWLYHSYSHSHRTRYLDLVETLITQLPNAIMPNGITMEQIVVRQIGAGLLISPIISEVIVLINMTSEEIQSNVYQLSQQKTCPIYIEEYDDTFKADTGYTLVESLNRHLQSIQGQRWIDLPLLNSYNPIIVVTVLSAENLKHYPRVPSRILTSDTPRLDAYRSFPH